jgi:hypothetical protein
MDRNITSVPVWQEQRALLTAWHLQRMGNSSQVEVCRQMKNRVLLTHHIADDEKLHIWDVDKKQAYQVISDDLGRWGQVTCAKWLPGVSDSGNFLCFGTGRGLVLIYHQAKQAVHLLSLERGKIYSQWIRVLSRNCQTRLSCLSMNLLKLWIMIGISVDSCYRAILGRSSYAK